MSTGAIEAQVFADLEGEFMIGPTVATWNTSDQPQVFAGAGMGVGFTAHAVHFGAGSVGVTVSPLIVIGQRADASGLDFQRFEIPIGVMLRVGDAGGNSAPGAVGGAITVGYGAILGAFSTTQIDTRLFLQFDVSVGIFKRGALKLRYRNALGDFLYEGSTVGYHGLYVVGSSAW